MLFNPSYWTRQNKATTFQTFPNKPLFYFFPLAPSRCYGCSRAGCEHSPTQHFIFLSAPFPKSLDFLHPTYLHDMELTEPTQVQIIFPTDSVLHTQHLQQGEASLALQISHLQSGCHINIFTEQQRLKSWRTVGECGNRAVRQT